jgi:hypothetical protein
LDKTIINIGINSNGSISNKMEQCSAYADDMVILRRSMRVTEEPSGEKLNW